MDFPCGRQDKWSRNSFDIKLVKYQHAQHSNLLDFTSWNSVKERPSGVSGQTEVTGSSSRTEEPRQDGGVACWSGADAAEMEMNAGLCFQLFSAPPPQSVMGHLSRLGADDL